MVNEHHIRWEDIQFPDVIKGRFARYELDPNDPKLFPIILRAFSQQGDIVNADVVLESYNSGMASGQKRSPFETTPWIEYEKQKKMIQQRVIIDNERKKEGLAAFKDGLQPTKKV